jgi:hypothetical protein
VEVKYLAGQRSAHHTGEKVRPREAYGNNDTEQDRHAAEEDALGSTADRTIDRTGDIGLARKERLGCHDRSPATGRTLPNVPGEANFSWGKSLIRTVSRRRSIRGKEDSAKNKRRLARSGQPAFCRGKSLPYLSVCSKVSEAELMQ